MDDLQIDDVVLRVVGDNETVRAGCLYVVSGFVGKQRNHVNVFGHDSNNVVRFMRKIPGLCTPLGRLLVRRSSGA